MKIGDKVYVFEENHRVYAHDANGRSFGGPIYREHFVEREIVGETTTSWIVGACEEKYKKNGNGKKFFTKEQVEEQVYIHDNAHKIANAVLRLGDYVTLKAIADLIGYKGDK